MIAIDLDTLGLSEKSIVLGISVVRINENEDYSFEKIQENCLFLKLLVEEQKISYGRTLIKSSVAFWKDQSDELKKIIFYPSKKDMVLKEALYKIMEFTEDYKRDLIFTKGFHDFMILKSLFEDAGIFFPFRYDYFREIRTAIDFIKVKSRNGVCAYPKIDKEIFQYSKDLVCLDVHMLLNGE